MTPAIHALPSVTMALGRRFMAPLVLAGIFCSVVAPNAHAGDVVRTPLLGSDFPILAAVTVPAGSDTIYLSGALALPVDKTAPKDSRAAYGDTEAQTLSALTNIKGTLARLGLGMGDVVKVTMFMAGDSDKGGKMDFLGMMKSYRKFFRHARSAESTDAQRHAGSGTRRTLGADRDRSDRGENPPGQLSFLPARLAGMIF